jgi:cation diffusion facilitator CzcD-associated flavoprotein CzcO
MVPDLMGVAVVGAGLSGLFLANAFASELTVSVAVLERTSYAGGVWRFYANATSRVNSSEPSYRLPIRRSQPNTNHSHKYEIIDDCCAAVQQLKSMAVSFCMQTDVSRVVQGGRGWHLGGAQRSARFLAQSQAVVLATARRLGAPRNLHHSGEDQFQGRVFRGLSGDVDSLSCASQRVVILGMGAFAIVSSKQ